MLGAVRLGMVGSGFIAIADHYMRRTAALGRGTGTIAAAAAAAEDARLLSTRVGDPLLVERRVISDAHGRLIEATESRYPADRYALDVRFDVEVPDPAPARIGG